MQIADESRFTKYITSNYNLFRTRTSIQVSNALKYCKGLFQSQKRNMERMCEKVEDSDYFEIQHFISDSPWDHRPVMDQVASNAGEILADEGPVALLIDESAHTKKGKKSVGVARQYCANTGKVDNCQVAVYAALSAGKNYCLIDTALFLPKEWTDDKKRCKAAGIPEEFIKYKSKPQLALQIVKHQLASGTRFDFVGADDLYGNDYSLQQSLDELGVLFMLEVHKDQYVYTEPPQIYVPEKQGSRGRTPMRYKTDSKAIEVQQLKATISPEQLQDIVIRQGTKGAIKCKGIAVTVYTWDGRSAKYNERQLVIRITETANKNEEIKFAITNAKAGEHNLQQLVQMQSQRYFIERALQEVKQEAGMSQYQARGWRSWYHHMALVIYVQGYLLSEKKLHDNEMPFLSAYDLREVILRTYAIKGSNYDEVLSQIKQRHKQRQADIERNSVKT